MRYVAPYGASDPNAPYINGDASVGIQGSIPPAEAFESPMRELVSLIEHSNFLPDQDDLEQVTKAVRSQKVNYAVDTGSANALSVAYDPPIVGLMVGLPLRVLVAHKNTGPSVITVNGLSAVSIIRGNGAALQDGDMQPGEVVGLVFDGTHFQISNYFGASGETIDNNYYEIGIPYTNDTSVTPNVITAPFSPAITTLAAGDLIEVKIANANTGATSITVNALPSKSVKGSDLQNLSAGQIVVGQIALLAYDGTQFQLINPVIPRPAVGSTQIAKRYFYQDPNYHITTVFNSYVEAFRVSFAPVAANDKIRVQFTGAFSSSAVTDYTIARAINGYVAYSTDGGSTWNPPSWPGRDNPSVGSFKANPGMTELVHSAAGSIQRIDFNFVIVGEMTVPAGPPTNVIFRLMFSSAHEANPTTIVHGGTIAEITEYTL